MEQHFFSIVIPAHNEGKYIAETLSSINSLDYPRDLFETIIVENGSSDNTLDEAKRFENDNTFVITSQKGVSAARNAGINKLNSKSEWVVFLDADTIPAKNFLKDFNIFVNSHSQKGYVVGTTSIEPVPNSIGAKIFFRLSDFVHFLNATSSNIIIANRKAMQGIYFDEKLSIGEDLKFISDVKKHGRFFLFWTKNITTSTRRFEQLGWFKVITQWVFVALLPVGLRRYFSYKTVR